MIPNTFYVRYPPEDGLPPTIRKGHYTTGETEREMVAINKVEACAARFLETGNPIEAINAVIYANDAGLYPPVWVMQFIAARFHKASLGAPLDKVFGFTGPGKGGYTRPQLRQRLDRRNHGWCIEMFKLQEVGLSRTAAGTSIAEAWSTRTGQEFDGRAVVKAVAENEHRYETEHRTIHEASKSWTFEERLEILKAYDPRSLPGNVRRQYKLDSD